MNRIKYILKKLKTLEYKSMIEVAKKINKKTGASVMLIVLDMIKCAMKYGSGYMDYFEFEFYLLNSKERSTYITSNINNEIVRKYNDKSFNYKFDDKTVFNEIFKEYLGRKYLDLKKCEFEEFEKFVKKNKKFVAKPVDETGGKGVLVVEIKQKSDVKKLYNMLLNNKQYLIEEFVVQDKKMNKLYDKSVNTLRIITFFDGKDVIILKTILKIGNGGSVDNFSSGGMYTFVNESGVVYVPAIDEEGNVFYEHPITKEKIVGFLIPKFEEVKKLVSEIGKKIKEVKYVGWDIAITKNGPVVIEGNNFSGIFQVKPSISGIKVGDLPNYRKYMDI